jgi:hypothetical protein
MNASSPASVRPNAEEALSVGDRVRLNKRGTQRFRVDVDRRGLVISVSQTKSAYKIRWDGQSTAEYLDWSYVARDAD